MVQKIYTKNMGTKILIGLFITTIISGMIFVKPVESKQLDWPVFQGNSARTGNTDSGIPQEPKLVWQLTVKNFKEKGIDPRGMNRPIIYNNKVFVFASEVAALDLNMGSFLWQHKEKNIYQGFIYALDEKTGDFLWKYQTQKPISHSAPLFERGKVFVGDDSGALYALDSKTGKLVWKKFLDAEVIHSSPAFYKGMVFIGTEGSGRSNVLPSHLFALDAETGNVIWKFQVDFISGKANLVHGPPAISNDVVYFGSENGYFYALDYDDGKLIWKKKIASGDKFLGGGSAPPTLSEGKIFATTWEGKLFSLEQKTGEIAWQKTFDESSQGGDAAAVTGNGMVCITIIRGIPDKKEGKFSCLNENNGEIVWQKEFFGGTPAATSGLLVVSNTDIADGSPDNTPVLLAFSSAKNADLPQISKAEYNKNSTGEPNWLFFTIIVIGVCFLACLGLLIYKIIKNRIIKIK